MKQPVSRNSFDRHNGYLGVYLQEGAPFVDASWNEGADIQWSLLRDAIRDAGLEGTAGIELRIDRVDGGLVARGGPGRFYCNGLPVLWPETRFIDVHGLLSPPAEGEKGRGEGEGDGEWRPRMIYLEAWVGVVDTLDLPDLDDPGLAAERGTFRKRVHSRIRVGRPHHRHTNVKLTVRGSYGADRNALYRVELLGVHEDSASLLWDSAAASVTALVTRRAEAGATEVPLGSTEGFDVGSFVRFEGPGVHQGLYRVTGRSADNITVQAHDCGKVSLVDCTGVTVGQPDAKGQIEVELTDARREDSPLSRLQPGRVVTELPANLGKASPPGGWLVKSVSREQRSRTLGHPDHLCTVTVLLAPNGLTDALDPWGSEHRSSLAVHAHPFHTCVEVHWPEDVRAQKEWAPGMRVLILADPDHKHQAPVLRHIETESGGHCKPGEETVETDEVRRVVRIIHHHRGSSGEGLGPTVTLVLDDPLSSEHKKGAVVVPERPIRARRYEGHACAVPIDVVDPSAEPSCEQPTSPYDLGGRQPLVPTGLSLLLTVEKSACEERGVPVGVQGEGWTFAARAGGWVERPIFAPVDEVQRGWAPLSEIRWGGETGYDLIDVRPVPASHAHHGWLADIADSAEVIAASGPFDAAWSVVESARRAEGKRAQPALVSNIGALAEGIGEWTAGRPACERARALLLNAVSAVHDPHQEIVTAAELSRLASAMERLCCAVSLAYQAPPPEMRKPEEPPPAPVVEEAVIASPPVVEEAVIASPAQVEEEAVIAPPPPVVEEAVVAAVAEEAPPPVVEEAPIAPPPVVEEAVVAAVAEEAPPPPVVVEEAVIAPAPVVEEASIAAPPPVVEEAVLAPVAEEAPPPPVVVEEAVIAPVPVVEEAVLAAVTEEAPPPVVEEVSIAAPPPVVEEAVLAPVAEEAPPVTEEAVIPPPAPVVEERALTAPPAPPVEEEAPIAPAAEAPAVDVIDVAALPTRLVHSPKAIPPAQRRRWPSLNDVPAPSTLPRGQERRFADVVATLLDQTATIGRRAIAGEDRAVLEAALDSLWKTRFDVEKLERPLRLEDAIAFHSARAGGGKP